MGKLNDNQLKQVAEFLSNLSLVFFAVVVAPIFSKIDTVDPFGVILGLIAAMSCMCGSVLLLRDHRV